MRTCINLMVTMLLCGLWHGAGWTFVFWGGWHGGGLVVHRLLSQPKDSHQRSALNHIFAMCGTFLFVHIGWVFFRAQDFAQASIILKRMFLGGGTLSWVHPFIPACILATIFLHIIKIVKGEQFILAPVGKPMTPFILLSMLLLSIVFASTGFTPFIYAQF
jgi:alginate O-acetyltransferase complex protein AlgI